MHPAALEEKELFRNCTHTIGRDSGPGGQHRNKVSTANYIKHLPSGITARATESRSREINRKAVIFRLRVKLALGIRHKIIWPYQPSPLWMSRLKKGKIFVNPKHPAFPALLAEAMDVLDFLDMDVKEASYALRCTASQLVKFLSKEPKALLEVNKRRLESGLKKLQ